MLLIVRKKITQVKFKIKHANKKETFQSKTIVGSQIITLSVSEIISIIYEKTRYKLKI